MTIKEATSQGIARIRLPQWENPDAYLRIDLIDIDGTWGHGPWLHLFDRPSQEIIEAPTPQTLLYVLLYSDTNDFEKYSGPIDEADTAAVTL